MKAVSVPQILQVFLPVCIFIVGLLWGGQVYAQGAPTNNILPLFQSDTQAKTLFEACKDGKTSGQCTHTSGNIVTSCEGSEMLGWTCSFTHSGDGSRVVARPNVTRTGSVFTNYDSSQNSDTAPDVFVGRKQTAFFGLVTTEEVGTGVGAGNLNSASCSEGNLAVCFKNLPGMLFTGLAFLFLMLSSGLLWLAGTVFNWVVIRTVFQFSTYFGTSDGMLLAWGIMRDVANIGLLFGFILMGVLLILNVDGGGHGHGHGGGISAKKAIPRLIIFAVLLNFSLFASQFVIDVSNAFSASFATLAGEQCTTATSNGASTEGGQELEDCANVGIAGQILQVAGVNKVWVFGENSDEAFRNLADRPYSYTVSLILLSIFVLVTAIVLLAGAIMLVFRVVVLTLLMITSPIGFAGMAIPKLQGIASMWWDKLISQSFFAPVYLLLIFMSVKLSEGLMQGNASLASALIASEGNTVAGNMQVAMVFMVVIGLMIASLIAASKMGAMGASFATNSASAVVFGAATRGTNFAFGGSARGLRALQQRTGLGGRAGEVAVNRFIRPVEKMNLDARRLPGVASALGAAGVTAGAKAAEHATYGDIAHQFSDIKASKAGEKMHEEYEQERKDGDLERNAHHGHMTPADKAHLASLSTKELEQLHGIKEGVQEMAENLSPEQFENIMKSDKLSEIEKGNLKASRFKSLNAAAAASDADTVKNLVKSMSKKDLENAPNGVLLQPLVLDALSDQQREDLTKSDKRSPAEKAAIKKSYANEILKEVFASAGKGAAGAAAVAAHPKFASISTAQFADLGVDILEQDAIAGNIPVAVLEKIVKDNKLSPAEMKRVGAKMTAASTAGTASAGVKGYMAPGSIKGDFWR